MNFEEFLKSTETLPVIETENLLAGMPQSDSIRVQISRWTKAGKIIKLKRGIYLPADPYRRLTLYEPHLASILKRPSYISLEKALEYHGLIPESVPVYTSVTTKRPGKFISDVGTFDYRHIKPSLFWGYNSVTVHQQIAFIASPEKGLLDLLYLTPVNVSLDYLVELRLQNVEKLDLKRLFEAARRFKKPKILAAAEVIRKYMLTYKKGEKTL